jgi:predicted metalloprotease
MFAGEQNLSVRENENCAYFPSTPAGSFYTPSTLCDGLLVVLAATLRIGEASRAAASAGDQLKQYGASGEIAQAYVIAHEIGHHVQNVLGIESKVRAMQQRNPRARNQLSVAMELQADCFAGVWARSTADRKILEQGDVPAALQAAAAVGDDRMQKMARGYVTPDSFTHGSSQQRVGWFNRGLNSGRVSACNTFSAAGQAP